MTRGAGSSSETDFARRSLVGRLLSGFESVLYVIVGALLVASAGFVLVGTVSTLTREISAGRDGSEIGIELLDRTLLLLIVAELTYTLLVGIRTHEIKAEPFLFTGLIAVLRRILVVTSELERPVARQDLTNLLLELGMLTALTIGLAAAIFLVRRSTVTTGDRTGHE